MMICRPPGPDTKVLYTNSKLPIDHSNKVFIFLFHEDLGAAYECFQSGPYVIVGLANDADREVHTTQTATDKMKFLAFDLVESPEQISARNIFAWRCDDHLLRKTTDNLCAEI